jgi:hypothetical protein
MKLKPAIFLFLVVLTAAFFSACTSVESKNSEEVTIEDKTNGSREEVIITNADVKDVNQQVSTTQATTKGAKRLLSDRTEIVTSFDGYGNKTEIRYFPGNARIRYVSLRTATDGSREVTVYAANGSAKIVTELGDDALTLPGDQIANTAQISTTPPASPVLRNYMKSGKTQTQTPLQPLPSSSFQRPPTVQYPQPVEPVQPQTNTNNENPAQQERQQQKNPEQN